MAETMDALERLAVEEADAWFEYLATTRSQEEQRYREIETWAWARLSERLHSIRSQRNRLRRRSAAA
jgi:hypothetical protein